MAIAIISDIHDNLANLKKFLKWSKENKIISIICCGDLTNSETLNILANGFSGKIYLVKGNIELYEKEELRQYKNIKYYGKIGVVDIDKVKIGICHEPEYIKEIFKKEKCDMIFYGHTHKPWFTEENGVKIINPGTSGGVFQKATFAVLDADKSEVELKILETI